MLSFPSRAKVNLGLKVLNLRDDGYHNLHSLFIELDLADELIFTPSSDFKLSSDYINNIQLPLEALSKNTSFSFNVSSALIS